MSKKENECPKDSTLTKIDAIILRAFEMDSNFNHEDLEVYILERFDTLISVKERLAVYQNEDTGFDFNLN